MSRPVFFNASDFKRGYMGYQAMVSHLPKKEFGSNSCSTIYVKARDMSQAIDRVNREARARKLKKFCIEQITRFMPI